MIHDKYNKLNASEKELVDTSLKQFTDWAKQYNPPIKISGCDPIEKVAEAMAVCIMESK